jgi:hypothetical protein
MWKSGPREAGRTPSLRMFPLRWDREANIKRWQRYQREIDIVDWDYGSKRMYVHKTLEQFIAGE